jgi:tetratricopeptide (TPR) repeat protein
MDPDQPQVNAPAVGRQLGPWRLDRRLGAGGMAVVYAATHTDGHLAALKVMHRDAVDPAEHTRFLREYRVLSAIRHPNVVRVDGLETYGGWPVLAMELVDGDDLEGVLAAWRASPPPDRFERAERILRDLCLALEAVHAHGLVHRDLKPGNVLVATDGTTKLTDFGVVKQLEAPSLLTQAGRLVGTIAYMAPELIAEETVDARTDLYGLGAILYTMLTLRRPIEADSVAGYLSRNLSEPPQPPHEIDPSVPQRLERVCLRLLEKHPDLRYPSARAVLEALDGHQPPSEPIHGRDDELRAWVDRLAALRRSEGAVVWVTGERGAGRSALLRAFVRLARNIGLSAALLEDSVDADVLVADDFDEADPPLRDRASDRARAVRAGAALVLVLATDHPPNDPSRHDLILRLGPLAHRALVAMLRDLRVPTPIATALARRWADTSGGLPGRAVEQLEALLTARWLVVGAQGLDPTRSLTAFQHDDLPPPPRVRAEVLARAAELDADARELAELLATLGRDVGATVLVRALEHPVRGPAAVDGVLRSGLAVTEAGADDHVLRLRLPGAAAVLRAAMAPDQRQARHAALARALTRQRRRSSWSEIARHFDAAGLPAEAAPAWRTAAEAALRAERPDEAVRAAEAGLVSLADAEDRPADRYALVATMGTALLAVGRWPEAVAVLQDAVALARSAGGPPALAASLTELGRAMHRLGRFEDATAPLDEALALTTPADPYHQRALRTLADVDLQRGDVDRAAARIEASLASALAARSPADEARARRGLAHVAAMRADYSVAADALEHADELLLQDGDPHVRASVLARRIELEIVAGRLAFALPRADVLVDLCTTRNLGRRTAEALALAALARQRVGQADAAADLAVRALALARADAWGQWEAVLTASRVLLDLGQPDAVPIALLEAAQPIIPAHDPAGQALALRARALSTTQPTAARRAAREALARPPAHLGLAAMVLRTDVARALAAAGDRLAAREALAPVAGWLDASRSDGARLEIALARIEAAGEVEDAPVLARRIAGTLPGRLREDFLHRPDVERLLDAHPEPR